MKILSKALKSLPDTEQVLGKVTSIQPNGVIFVLGDQGRRLQATSGSSQSLAVGDRVTVVLSSPPSIVGKTSFKAGSGKVVFI